MKNFTLIRDIRHLKKLANDKDEESIQCFISLAGGAVQSSKDIWYDEDTVTFSVFNYIDETEQENLTEVRLASQTNIVEAIKKGALYKDNY